MSVLRVWSFLLVRSYVACRLVMSRVTLFVFFFFDIVCLLCFLSSPVICMANIYYHDAVTRRCNELRILKESDYNSSTNDF
jgi:hypothetical protein